MKINVSFDNPKLKADLILKPDYNLVSGKREFGSYFKDITSLEEDLLILSSSIFASDLANKRKERENFARNFTLTIPVINYSNFIRIKNKLEDLLYKLSNDNWEIIFTQRKGDTEKKNKQLSGKGKTLLFSGGLDSFAGAFDLGNETSNYVLVSHITHNRIIRNSQEVLYDELYEKNKSLSRYSFLVSGRKYQKYDFPQDRYREETQRTRSFLFLSLATLVARRTGFDKIIYIAENGLMAIHLPLTAARIGAFSTHTAHPEVVSLIQDILREILDYNFNINNPYLYHTKAETISGAIKKFPKLIPKTISCWRGSRVGGSKIHCGVCVPCLMRRIAIEFNDKRFNEYERDLFKENISKLGEDDIGKRNLSDLLEIIYLFNGSYSETQIKDLYPELINEHIDFIKAIKVYQRFSKEATKVLRSYKDIKKLL